MGLYLLSTSFSFAQSFSGKLLIKARKKGSLGEIKALLWYLRLEINDQDEQGNSPLLIACKKGHDDIVHLLLSHPKINVNIQNKWQHSALHWASQRGDAKVAHLLLKSPQIAINQVDERGKTALHWGSQKGHGAIVSLLLGHKKIKPNLRDDGGKKALDYLIAHVEGGSIEADEQKKIYDLLSFFHHRLLAGYLRENLAKGYTIFPFFSISRKYDAIELLKKQ